MKKIAQKNKKMTMSQILTKYNSLIDDIKKLQTAKTDYNNQILKALGYDDNKPKKLYTKQIGKHIVMCKVSQSYSLDLSEVKKEFPKLVSSEIPPAIANVNYSIYMNQLKPFQIEKEDLIDFLNDSNS